MINPASPASWTEIDHDDVTPTGCITPSNGVKFDRLSDEIPPCEPPTPITTNDGDIYTQCITWASDVLWALRHPIFTTSRCTVAVTDITDHRLSSGKTANIYDEDAVDDSWRDRFNSIISIADEPQKAYDPPLNTIMRVSAGSKFAFDADRVLEVHGGLVFAWCQVGGGNITDPVWVLVAIRSKVTKEDTVMSRVLKMACDLFGSEEKSDKRKRSTRRTPDPTNYDTHTLYAVCSADEDIRNIIIQNTIRTNSTIM